MLNNLTQRLSKVVKTLKGEARLTEANTAQTLRDIRMALLEADVALPVVRDLIARVKEKALGQEVLGALSPGQALVGVVHKELAALIGADLGKEASQLNLAVQPPAVILMAGLQGAGKTTTVGKLTKYLIESRNKKVLTVSADVYRPAAIEQLAKLVAPAAGQPLIVPPVAVIAPLVVMPLGNVSAIVIAAVVGPFATAIVMV